MKQNVAEFLGTFWLVLGGCGSAVLAASFPELGIGHLGVALAFGFTIVAGGLLYVIASGAPDFDGRQGFAANGDGAHSPRGYSLFASLMSEVTMTMFFLLIILSTTRKAASKALAPVAIGLALALIHLISIPVTNTSVNPARSTGVALFAGGWAIAQLWLAPIAGALLGAGVHRFLTTSTSFDWRKQPEWRSQPG